MPKLKLELPMNLPLPKYDHLDCKCVKLSKKGNKDFLNVLFENDARSRKTMNLFLYGLMWIIKYLMLIVGLVFLNNYLQYYWNTALVISI